MAGGVRACVHTMDEKTPPQQQNKGAVCFNIKTTNPITLVSLKVLVAREIGKLMSEEPANKRRRFESPNTVSLAAATPLATIASLPGAVLQYCFSFIGKFHYRYVAGTSRRFKEVYIKEHEKKTEWEHAARSCFSFVRQALS